LLESPVKKTVSAQEASPGTSRDATQEKSDEVKILSVSDLNEQIRGLLEGTFGLIWIKGEISNFKKHTSGHCYFSLKDSKSQINAVMFRGSAAQLQFRPTDGMEVVIRGRVSVYSPRGNYQVYAELMEPLGLGSLQVAFEQLKAKLAAEGLFDPAKKRPLPALPRKIAVVTSPTGAAVRDILSVLKRRFAGLDVTIIPTNVQGKTAAQEIANAIDLANRIAKASAQNAYEVLIIGRGGGSMEDLWSFNEEIVARAIAASSIPTISAVGHEVDFTIADFVADVRAPTPSAAAEIVIRSAQEFTDKIRTLRDRSALSMKRYLLSRQQLAQGLEKRLVDPKRKLRDLVQRLDELQGRLEIATVNYFERLRAKIESIRSRVDSPERKILRLRDELNRYGARMNTRAHNAVTTLRMRLETKVGILETLSPLKVLGRGYSIVKKNEEIIREVAQVKSGDSLEVILHKGTLDVTVK